MRRVLIAVFAPLMLAGCTAAIGYIMEEYKGVEAVPFAIEGEDVYRVFDKPSANKLMITPSIANSAGAGFAQGLAFGAIDATPPKPMFERASLAYLTSTGRKCRILDGALLAKPQWEFKYDCSIPAPPLAEARPRRR